MKTSTKTAESSSPSKESGGTEITKDISFENAEKDKAKRNSSQKEPRTVREFFMLLPPKFFVIECCEGSKEEYLKQYLMVEDTKNGYMDGGGDAAQSTFRMALFKRPDKTYLVALNVFGETQDDYFFLDYKGGEWKDISTEIIPEYGKDKIYEIPRNGTTMPVFMKKVLDSDGENDLTEKGEKLYDLVWQKGAFIIKR